jgi:hypothetical protein
VCERRSDQFLLYASHSPVRPGPAGRPSRPPPAGRRPGTGRWPRRGAEASQHASSRSGQTGRAGCGPRARGRAGVRPPRWWAGLRRAWRRWARETTWGGACASLYERVERRFARSLSLTRSHVLTCSLLFFPPRRTPPVSTLSTYTHARLRRSPIHQRSALASTRPIGGLTHTLHPFLFLVAVFFPSRRRTPPHTCLRSPPPGPRPPRAPA